MEKKIFQNEQELIVGLKKDDSSAFEQIFWLYNDRLFRFAKIYFHNNEDAEEIIQDVFLKLWKSRTTIRTNDTLKSYLFQIAYHSIKEVFLKKNREEKYKQQLALEYLREANPEIETADYELVMRQVDRLIGQLPPQRQQIFILNKKEGLSISEISEYLDISQKTVKNHLSLAIAQMRQEAKEKGLAQLLFFQLFFKS